MAAPIVRIGILGLGIAGSLMAEACVAYPQVALVAGADLDDQLLDRFTSAWGAPTERDSARLFSRADIDAIYIATPHQFHA